MTLTLLICPFVAIFSAAVELFISPARLLEGMHNKLSKEEK